MLIGNAPEIPMNSHLVTICIALLVGFVGGLGGQIFQSKPVENNALTAEQAESALGPGQSESDAGDLAMQVARMRQEIASLRTQLTAVVQQQAANTQKPQDAIATPDSGVTARSSELSDVDYLAAVGVDPSVANDILRRISQQQFRRLELTNLVRGSSSSERQLYAAELREMNQNAISLRSELGTDIYDQYLFESGANNRVKVDSVLAGSPAETHGVQPGDVIQYYNDTKIIEISDLQRAALGGEAGGYSNIQILRQGNLMNLMLPHGTIGVQLRPTRIDPGE